MSIIIRLTEENGEICLINIGTVAIIRDLRTSNITDDGSCDDRITKTRIMYPAVSHDVLAIDVLETIEGIEDLINQAKGESDE